MLGLSLGREYRDRVNSGPSIPEQFYTDSEGSACSSPTYGFDLSDLSNATIGTAAPSGIAVTDQSSPTNNGFQFAASNVTSGTLLPSFQGKNNVIRIVFLDGLGSAIALLRAGGNIRALIYDSSNSQLDFSNVAHPNWSHHLELTYWVDTNYEDNPNNEISTTINSSPTYCFGGNTFDALSRQKVAPSISDPRDQWTTIKLDIFDQTADGSSEPLLYDTGEGVQTMSILTLPSIYSDSYPPGGPSGDPATHFGPSAMYIAGVKYTICPRT